LYNHYHRAKVLCGGEAVGNRGRPRIHDSDAEKMKAFRQSKKAGGLVGVRLDISLEYKQMLDDFCKKTNQSLSAAVCDLLDRYCNDVLK
jgi:hypothetical protein